MITFGDLQNGAVGRASGLDVQGFDFLQYSNDAVRQLINRGNWWSSVMPMIGCVRSGVITWPRGVATILGLNFCDRQTILSNRWYQFMQPDSRHRQWAQGWSRQGWYGQLRVESSSTSPVFNPIMAEGFSIRTFITNKADIGKTVTYFGVDVNGQPVQSARADGTIQDGELVTLANPSVDTANSFRHVTRVLKDVTHSDIIAYQHNVSAGFLLDLARYQPTETSPAYITTVVRGHGCDQGCNRQVEALVKVSFVPFQFSEDLVQIDNEDAIRDMLLAIRKKEQGDITASISYETSAIRELNYQMKNRFPDEQFIVNFRPFGRDDLNNYSVRIGQI